MADFKVSAEKIELFDHPNADRLQIAKVGMYSLVVGKGTYENGDIVVFAPKRSILPEDIRDNYKNEQTGQSYLKRGSVVQSIKMRGEPSEGVVIDASWALEKLGHDKSLEEMIGHDLSDLLGVVEDIPHIPAQFQGKQSNMIANKYSLHDCESIRLHSREFVEGEEIIVSEKVHGTQINIIIHADGETVEIGSKGLLKKGISIAEDETNIYWRAFHASHIHAIIKRLYPNQFVQVMGEVIPSQKGYDYGCDTSSGPMMKIFRLEVDGVRISVADLDQSKASAILDMWVPWQKSNFDLKVIEGMAKGMEGVSGKSRHIKEGVVIEPYPCRNASRGGWPLIIKVINPKYKGDDDDMS